MPRSIPGPVLSPELGQSAPVQRMLFAPLPGGIAAWAAAEPRREVAGGPDDTGGPAGQVAAAPSRFPRGFLGR